MTYFFCLFLCFAMFPYHLNILKISLSLLLFLSVCPFYFRHSLFHFLLFFSLSLDVNVVARKLSQIGRFQTKGHDDMRSFKSKSEDGLLVHLLNQTKKLGLDALELVIYREG